MRAATTVPPTIQVARNVRSLFAQGGLAALRFSFRPRTAEPGLTFAVHYARVGRISGGAVAR